MIRPVDPVQRKRAKSLRANMTDAERRLWGHLRAHRFEAFHFRRQVPIGPFIADFVCHRAKLIIEVDGGQHSETDAGDARRTAWLNNAGYRVMRFWNFEILTGLEGVMDAIHAALMETGRHGS